LRARLPSWDIARSKEVFSFSCTAAQLGDPDAQLNLAYCYDVGKGATKRLSRDVLIQVRSAPSTLFTATHKGGRPPNASKDKAL
jgi:hypothetical protein